MPTKAISWTVAGAAGLLFGIGLAMSSMLNPARVLGFLDVFGDWDPTLAFVMGGAIAVTAPVTYWLKQRERTALGDPLDLPDNTSLDTRLLGGAAIFGVGWGLVGLCPGPALASLALAWESTWLFVVALVVGSLVHRVTHR